MGNVGRRGAAHQKWTFDLLAPNPSPKAKIIGAFE